ncbi:MAG: hypothetical protein ACO2O2_09390 [Acidilobaceae archaeon]
MRALLPVLITTLTAIALYLGIPLWGVVREYPVYRGASLTFTAIVYHLITPSIILVILGLILRSRISVSLAYALSYLTLIVVTYAVLLLTPLRILSWALFIVFQLLILGGDGPRVCYYIYVEELPQFLQCLWVNSPSLAMLWASLAILLVIGLSLEFTLIYVPLSKAFKDRFIPLYIIPARVLSIPALLLLVGAIGMGIGLPIMAILALPYTYTALDIERRLLRTPNIVLVVLGILTAGLIIPLYLYKVYVEYMREKHAKTMS